MLIISEGFLDMMRRPGLARSFIRAASGPALYFFDKPILHRHVDLAIHVARRLIGTGIYEGEVNGVKMSFYDPGRGPDAYWTSFYSKSRLYEHSVLTNMKRVASLHRKPTFVDVGAHYGFYTAYMSKLKGPSSKVLSFEPNEEYFRVLSLNVRLNGARNVSLHRLALSNRKGEIVLETSERFRERGYSEEKRKMMHVEGNSTGLDDRVKAIPFDDLPLDISPYIIKVDVHGAEGNVITGMRRTLEEGIGHLFCELHSEMCDDYTAKDVVEVLQKAGMEIFELQRFRRSDGKLVKVSTSSLAEPDNRMIYAIKSS
jgi:FkbM family methyltransferase